MKISKKIISLIMVIALTGCATIFSGTTQDINVKVVDKNQQEIPGAICEIKDGSGASYTLPSNPGIIKVSKANGSVTINCSKAGYKQSNTLVGDSFNAVTLVNVLFWPGFIVDAVSGAYKKLPTHYVVTMDKV